MRTRRAKPGKKPRSRQFVTALSRGLDVLRAFTGDRAWLGNQELAALTGLPKPTISRLTYTLTELGYLRPVESHGKYELGTGVLTLGFKALGNLSVRQVARPLMQQLADEVNVGVSLGSRDRLEAVYVEHCRSNATVTLRLDIGSRLPLASTAMGRALLAGMAPDELELVMQELEEAAGSQWPRLRRGLIASLESCAATGFTCSVGEWEPDVNAIGVPLKTPAGAPLALNCGGPAYLLPKDRLERELGPRLVSLARSIEASLPHAGEPHGR